MKLCCSSRSFARSLHSGALTQLEWIDRCADTGVDGVEFAAAHFPRVDEDYLAQLKKLCVDRGLTIASLAMDAPFGDDVDAQSSEYSSWIQRAQRLGAPLVRFRCGAGGDVVPIAWRELIRGLKLISAAAKGCDVALALEPASGSLVADPPALKRAIKECDSSWLRCAAPCAAVADDEADAWAQAAADTIIVVCERVDARLDAALRTLRSWRFIGFVTYDDPDVDDARARVALDTLRAHMR